MKLFALLFLAFFFPGGRPHGTVNVFSFGDFPGVLGWAATVQWLSGDRFEERWEGGTIEIDGQEYSIAIVETPENMLIVGRVPDYFRAAYTVERR